MCPPQSGASTSSFLSESKTLVCLGAPGAGLREAPSPLFCTEAFLKSTTFHLPRISVVTPLVYSVQVLYGGGRQRWELTTLTLCRVVLLHQLFFTQFHFRFLFIPKLFPGAGYKSEITFSKNFSILFIVTFITLFQIELLLVVPCQSFYLLSSGLWITTVSLSSSHCAFADNVCILH